MFKSIEVEGVTSTSIVLLIDIEIGSFPPYIYIPIFLGIETSKTTIGILVGKS
jgi:hypothetical protein